MPSAGWIGSGFDCGCECTFQAGFHYDGNEPAYWGQDPPPICQLIFTVGGVLNGCESVDISTTGIIVELRRNGTVISEPMTYLPGLNAYYWERWKPIAGDVYTATVTLTCSGGSGGGPTTVTRNFSYTIPTPANTLCVCCDERVPDFVTVSGLSNDCCLPINGTYALSPVPSSPCQWDAEVNFPDPGDCATFCDSCTALDTEGFLSTYFYSPKKVRVIVGIGVDPITNTATPNPDTIVTYVRTESAWIYRQRTVFGVTTCELYTGPELAICLIGAEWRMESLCNGGAMTFTQEPGEGSVCIFQSPDVRIYFQ